MQHAYDRASFTPEVQLIEAARALVSAVTDHRDPAKRAAKLGKLETQVRGMLPHPRPTGGNVVCIVGGKSLSEPTEAERQQAAVASLILSAVAAERSAVVRRMGGMNG